MSYINPTEKGIRRVTTLSLQEMKNAGRKIVALTAYDALMASVLDSAGVDVILVGDSLGNIVQGHDTTIPVTLEDVIYHTKAVVNGASRALVVADMPFMTYQVSSNEAFRNAGRLIKETGCTAVKIEGGENVVEAISRMTEAGIPVIGHLGLMPQSINKYGSYRARGTDPEEASRIYREAHSLQQAGVCAIVLEKIPAELAAKITESLTVPTIGIGAGPNCDGQVLVYTDMLGLTVDFSPRFVRRYANLYDQVIEAVKKYGEDVRSSDFPSLDESY